MTGTTVRKWNELGDGWTRQPSFFLFNFLSFSSSYPVSFLYLVDLFNSVVSPRDRASNLNFKQLYRTSPPLKGQNSSNPTLLTTSSFYLHTIINALYFYLITTSPMSTSTSSNILMPTTTLPTLLLPPTPPTTLCSASSSLRSTSSSHVDTHPTGLTVTDSDTTGEDLPPGHDLRLYTTPRGHIYTYDEDMFASHPHRVVGFIQRPPTTLAIGMRVQLGSVRGTLTRIYGVQRERVLFVLQPDELDHAYVVLRVHPRYAKLSQYWRMRLRIYPWTHWCH